MGCPHTRKGAAAQKRKRAGGERGEGPEIGKPNQTWSSRALREKPPRPIPLGEKEKTGEGKEPGGERSASRGGEEQWGGARPGE